MQSPFVITGANRGIGLGFVRALLRRGKQVIATCRDPDNARDLFELKVKFSEALRVEKLNVTRKGDIDAFVESMRSSPVVGTLIHSAGISPGGYYDSVLECSREHLLASFETNCVAPVKISQALLPFLRKKKGGTIVFLSSRLASIEGNVLGSHEASTYRASKASLNMLARSFAWAHRDVQVVAMSPGHVDTDMGRLDGQKPTTSVDSSVESMLRVLDELTREKPNRSGIFLNADGSEIPW